MPAALSHLPEPGGTAAGRAGCGTGLCNLAAGWLDATATIGSAPRGCLLSVVVADVVAKPPNSFEITGKPPVGKVCGRPRHVKVQW